MEKSFNIRVEELKEKLFEIVNESGLPFSSIYYLFKDFMKDLTDAYIENLNKEYQKEKEETTENEENIN